MRSKSGNCYGGIVTLAHVYSFAMALGKEDRIEAMDGGGLELFTRIKLLLWIRLLTTQASE